jgi:hypothetical protein
LSNGEKAEREVAGNGGIVRNQGATTVETRQGDGDVSPSEQRKRFHDGPQLNALYLNAESGR